MQNYFKIFSAKIYVKYFLLKGYDILVPPFPLEYDEWSQKRAEEYLEWYVAHIPERVKYLSQKAGVQITGERIPPETLIDIWAWFFQNAEIEKTPKKELEKQRVAFGQFGESFIAKTRYTVRSEYILRDIAMYLSAVFTTNHPVIHWDIIRKPKRDIFYHQPVLKGFLDTRYEKPFESTFQPDHMVHIQAVGFRKGNGSSSDLLNLYRLWEQDIPQENIKV